MNVERPSCVGLLGILFGHKYSDVGFVYDFCLRCGLAKEKP